MILIPLNILCLFLLSVITSIHVYFSVIHLVCGVIIKLIIKSSKALCCHTRILLCGHVIQKHVTAIVK